MRRSLASLVLTLLLVPAILPMFGPSAVEASLPACCRRNGKHHCMMSMQWMQRRTFRTIQEKCPYNIVPPAAMVLPAYTPSAPATTFAGLRRHPVVVVQTEAQFRVTFDRTRQKRGPPARSA